MQKVLVTGSAGFIGRHLTHLLSNSGYDVLGVDKRHSEIDLQGHKGVDCDILDFTKLHNVFFEYQPDFVVHLAARTDLNEHESLQGYASNIQGTVNLIKAIDEVRCVKRVLFTSSQLVCRIGYIPISDTDYQPNNFYGESKVLTEKIVRNSKLSDVTWCLLRPTTIWGEGMSAHYQQFIRLVKEGRFFHVGRKPLYKSYGYVGNAVYQYKRFMEAPAELVHGRTFYIADYQPLSLRRWVDDLAIELNVGKVVSLPEPIAWSAAYVGDFINLLGFRSFPFNSFRLRNILTEYIFDLSATEGVCGPLPFTVENGISRTVRWFDGLR